MWNKLQATVRKMVQIARTDRIYINYSYNLCENQTVIFSTATVILKSAVSLSLRLWRDL